MTVKRITIEYEDGTSEVLTPAEWMGVMLGTRSGVSSVQLLDNTMNSSSVDPMKETFQSARNLVSAVEEEEIVVQIEPLPISSKDSELVSMDAPAQASPVKEEPRKPVAPPTDDGDKSYRQATIIRFPFGKYKGRTILELVLNDSEFAEKCAKQLSDNGKHRELANAITLVLARNPDI
ncbi:hypothetical protein N9N26_01140 [Candidatus Poseidoniales archaeon]|jgi:uncharacterized protein (DUF3820 family)|nr:hypothetical protein [Candidatus Poseidoniales archaeon]